ncbi:MAG: hypothetical protein JXQ79_03185 [Rhodobacteraceae bacterium]|nr:hypothetical protein [Paracoccaceae bacterium]
MKENTFISIWGSRAALARSIDEGETTVRAWFARGNIPSRYDSKIMAAAQDVGRPITTTDMFNLRQNMLLARASSKKSGALREERISHAKP